jgi:hypothetical protein
MATLARGVDDAAIVLEADVVVCVVWGVEVDMCEVVMVDIVCLKAL